jgi:ketosteroid isomerase-like protein
MQAGTGVKSDEAAIREVIDALVKAVRTRDVEAMIDLCSDRISTFDMIPPLKHVGADALRTLWGKTLSAFVPPIEYDIEQLELFVGGDVAFARSLNRFGGTQENGARTVNWLCSTLGFRKTDGRWKIVHEHVSVPFDMKTGKAMLDLEP